jgi:hypothetical protein
VHEKDTQINTSIIAALGDHPAACKILVEGVIEHLQHITRCLISTRSPRMKQCTNSNANTFCTTYPDYSNDPEFHPETNQTTRITRASNQGVHNQSNMLQNPVPTKSTAIHPTGAKEHVSPPRRNKTDAYSRSPQNHRSTRL